MRIGKTVAIAGTLLVAATFYALSKNVQTQPADDKQQLNPEAFAQGATQSPSSALHDAESDPEASPAHSGPRIPSLLQPVDDATLQILSPWTNTFVNVERVQGPVIDYEIVAVDANVLEGLRNGAINSYVFKLGENYSYEVAVDRVRKGPGFVNLFGSRPGPQPGPKTILIVYDNGNVEGSIGVPDVGGFYIKPTPHPPFHVLFHTNGMYSID
jgi:hypothetical protein